MGILNTGKMWATDSRFLNDSTETSYAIDILADVFREFLTTSDKQQTPEWIYCRKLAENIFWSVRQGFRFDRERYILSFSKVADVKSQWNEYCVGDVGYALQFNENPIAEQLLEDKGIFRLSEASYYNCNYDRSSVFEQLRKILPNLYDFDGDTTKALSDRQKTILTKILLSTKHESFREEQEVRWVAEADNFKVRPRNGVLTPYIEVPVNLHNISCIWVGPSHKQEAAVNGLRSYRKMQDTIGTPIEEQTLFRIERSQIPYSHI